MDDEQLLREYAGTQSEAAFRTLVERHVPLVYSAALRQVRDSSLAQDVTQVVFIILARKAARLSKGAILTGWLYRTTRFTAAKALRAEIRRRRREQEAVLMQSAPFDSTWNQLAPILDEAIGQLGESDRTALLLRFFENKSLREVGEAFGVNEDSAQKRVSRAVVRLREVLAKHGVTLSANAVTTAVSANAVQAAPAHLVSTVAAVGLTKTAGTAAAQMLLKETLRQLQLWFAVASGGGVVLTAAVILAVVWPREATTVTPGIAGTNIVFRTNRGRPGPEIAAGTANIRINLSDPVGQNFEVVYTHDGRSETVTGVLPREIEFQADAFTASIAVHGPGPFKYEVYRNGQLSGAGGGSNGSTNHIVNITSLAGGRGIRVDGHSGGAAARR